MTNIMQMTDDVLMEAIQRVNDQGPWFDQQPLRGSTGEPTSQMVWTLYHGDSRGSESIDVFINTAGLCARLREEYADLIKEGAHDPR
jgi:hypothetical protein